MTEMLTREATEKTDVLGELTARDICGLAAEYIEEHGWMQGDWACETGEVCVMGALYSVGVAPLERYDYKTAAKFGPSEDDSLNRSSAFRAYSDAVMLVRRAVGGPGGPFTSEWNDTPGRTKQEVVDTLRRIASS